MARLFLTPIDLGKLELLNPRLQQLGSDPSSPVSGQVYYNTGSNAFRVYNGSVWLQFGTLDQITAPGADVSLNSHKITNLLDPTSAQDAATRAYVLARSLSDFAAPTGDLAIGTHKLTGVSDGTAATDAATKGQLDAAINGLNWHVSARAASTANLAVASAVVNGAVVDGVTLATGDRILLKNQTTGGENGVYIVAASGAASRATDMDSAAEILQAALFIQEGTTQADTAWVNSTNAPITLGTTATVWSQFGAGAAYTGSTGIQLVGNDFRIENSGILLPAHGGTGIASPTIHKLLVGNGSSAMTQLAVGATGTVLRGATGADPAFAAIDLTTDVGASILPFATGGRRASTAAAARTSLGVPGKFAASVGDNSATSFNVDHNLGTLDVVVQVYRNSDGVEVEADITRSTTNRVVVAFAVAPASNAYRVVVIG